MTSLSMWNESATRASDPTAYPVMISMKKKTMSITRRVMIRVSLLNPILYYRFEGEEVGVLVVVGAVTGKVDALIISAAPSVCWCE